MQLCKHARMLAAGHHRPPLRPRLRAALHAPRARPAAPSGSRPLAASLRCARRARGCRCTKALTLTLTLL